MLTPEQLAKIRAKEAATPDALKRNPLMKYREGYFHVTLNTRGKTPVLGWLVGNADAPRGSEDAPRVILSDLGRKVQEVWERNPSIYPEVENLAFQIMPEHVHILWHLKAGNKRHLGQIVKGFMIGGSHGYWDTLGLPWREQGYVKGVRTPQWQDRDHTCSYRGPALFVHGYNEVEAVTDEEVEIKREYIISNPERRIIKHSEPEIFRVRRDKTSRNWTPERIMAGLCADRFIAADRSRQEEAWRQITTPGLRNSHGKISATLKWALPPQQPTQSQHHAQPLQSAQPQQSAQPLHPADSRPVLDLVGDLALLQRPLYPLVCHRGDAARYAEQTAAVMAAARDAGGVIVTACVSPRERDIVKQLQQELLPVIVVMDNGFSERYKPAGRAFYAVAESRRLEVSPWQYEYRRREMRPVTDEKGHPVMGADGRPEMEEIPDISRETCMVMNELVRVISGKSDDWWKG